MFLGGVEARGVTVVLGVSAVADDENLYVLKQPAACPEGVALVAVDLVEGLLELDAARLQFDVHQW